MGDLEGDTANAQTDGASRTHQQLDGDFSGDAASIVQLMSSESASSPHEVAYFLHQMPHMDPKMVGRVLGEPDEVSLSVLQEYANGFVFKDFSIDVALRVYLGRFVLPGEAQKIDRILQAFAKAYFAANPRDPICSSEDAIYTLAFSLVLLNTDAHNPHLAKRFKMGKEDFIRNHHRIIVDGKNMPHKYLAQCYDSFATYPITLIPKKEASMLAEDEVEIEFGEGPLGLEIETSIDGRTCLVKKYTAPAGTCHHQSQQQQKLQHRAHWHEATSASTKAAGPQLAGWVIVAVAGDCTRQLGYPITRYLLKTAARPVVVRFCEPSVYFASLE